MKIDQVGEVGVVLTEANEPVLHGGDQIIGYRSLKYVIFKPVALAKKTLVEQREGWVWQTRRRVLLLDMEWLDLPAARKGNATTRFRSRRRSTWSRSGGGGSSSPRTRNTARSSSNSGRSVRRPDCSRGSRRRKSTAGSGRKGRFGPRTAKRIGNRVANGRPSAGAVAAAGLAAPVPLAGPA